MNKNDPFYQSQLKKGRTNFWARYLNFETWVSRPLASLLVRLAYPTSVTPNQLTVIALCLSLGAAVLFAQGRPLTSLLAALLCQLSLIFDCADGMLARARNSCSRFGSYLDLFLDRISDFCVLLGIVIGYSGAGDKDRLILGLFIISLYLLQVILYYISNRFSGTENGDSGEGRAVAILYMTVMGALNRLDLIVYGMAAEVAVNLVFRVGKFLLTGWRAEREQSVS